MATTPFATNLFGEDRREVAPPARGQRLFAAAPATAPADAELAPGQFSVWVDEAADLFTVVVRYSDGTVKTGALALT